MGYSARSRFCGIVGATALLAAAQPVSADPIGWPQPNGSGTPVYLTYSYSNLLQCGFNTTLSAAELRAATEAAFGLWARYAPIQLFEVPDTGPLPSEHEYSPVATADIRIGYEPRLEGGDVAHAHVPFARDSYTASGLGGDIHFSNDLSAFDADRWGHDPNDALVLDFFSTMLHEAGHALGLLHIFDAPSVLGGSLRIFPDSTDASLFPADIAAVRALYGSGHGSVHPLGQQPIPNPEPGSMLLLAAGAGALALRRRQLRYNVPSWVPTCGLIKPRSVWPPSSNRRTTQSSART
jgi:hypothetical protein